MFLVSRLLSAMLSVAILAASYTFSSFSALRPLSASDITTKLHVLGELGIEFSQETGLSIEQSLYETASTWADLGIDVPISSYPIILSMLGIGKYDPATQGFIPVTNSVYAFDAECLDITKAYGDFLLAVSRISNEEIRIDDYHSEVSEATFEAGIGTQEVTFTLNGNPYRFTAQFYYDWMDCTIIDYVNRILDEQGIDKRLWCMFDDGQGFVVFYNSAEWAREFSRRTNCPLAVQANGAF
ncbi:MAG: hypothetical protein FWF69_01355 [Firmicutes bacterium]|nr:hypothetical protein [Bacillota bacterium]